MSKEIPDLSEMRSKISDLEKENLTLHSQIELLNNELSNKTTVLNQTNSELTELQKQYRESLDKIVELSKKTSNRNLSPEEERIYRLQLAEQASCISTLQDRLWESENQRRQAIIYGSFSSSSGSFDRMQSATNNKYYSNHEIDCTSNYRRPSFCDPIPNIDKAEKKIISLHHKLLEMSKQNDYFISELKGWSKFVIQIFNIATEALNEYPAFPTDDPSAQQKITLNVVNKLAKAHEETPKVYEKYSNLKEKYQELKNYLSTIEKRCDHLSQVTQLKTFNANANMNNFHCLNSDINEEDFSYYQKDKCFKSKNSSIKPRSRYQFEDSDSDFINNQYSNRKAYSKSKYNEKKIENCICNQNDTELDHINENVNFNKKLCHKSNEYLKGNSDFSLSDNSRKQFNMKPNQIKRQKKIITTDETERIINENSYRQSTQNSNKPSFNKQIKLQTKEKNTQTKFNNTYPQGKSCNDNDDSDDLYSNLGANISRLSKITKNMKNDYYDFAKYAKEIDTESYSIEELSKRKSK